MSKVYIITDMEGVAGVNGWYECRPEPAGRATDYERARLLLSREVAAAVRGAQAGGAQEIVVLDGHRGGGNFIAEELPAGARYVMGRGKSRPLDGLTADFEAVILLGYHPMARTPDGLLSHTMSPDAWKSYSINGTILGEIGMMALIAGGRGVPVWLITGGRAACEEAQALLGDQLPTLVVKEDLAHEASMTIAPAEARQQIQERIASVISAPPATRPFLIEGPLRVRLEVESKQIGDGLGIPARFRQDDTTFEGTIPSTEALMPRYWE